MPLSQKVIRKARIAELENRLNQSSENKFFPSFREFLEHYYDEPESYWYDEVTELIAFYEED